MYRIKQISMKKLLKITHLLDFCYISTVTYDVGEFLKEGLKVIILDFIHSQT